MTIFFNCLLETSISSDIFATVGLESLQRPNGSKFTFNQTKWQLRRKNGLDKSKQNYTNISSIISTISLVCMSRVCRAKSKHFVRLEPWAHSYLQTHSQFCLYTMGRVSPSVFGACVVKLMKMFSVQKEFCLFACVFLSRSVLSSLGHHMYCIQQDNNYNRQVGRDNIEKALAALSRGKKCHL